MRLLHVTFTFESLLPEILMQDLVKQGCCINILNRAILRRCSPPVLLFQSTVRNE